MSIEIAAAVIAGTLVADQVTTPAASEKIEVPPAPPKPKIPTKLKAPQMQKDLDTVITYEEGIITLKLVEIDVPSSGNVTRPEGPGDVAELMASLKATGQQTPVIVQRVKGEKLAFRLAAGFRRMAALKQLRHATVECRVLESSTEIQRVLANVTENENSRREIGPLGRLAGYEALAALGHSVIEVAQIVGRAEDFVRDTLRIATGIDEIRAALALPEGAEGSCSWGVARQILRFPKAEQKALLRRCSRLSVEASRSLLAEYRRMKKAQAVGEEEGEEGEGGEGEGDEGEGAAKKAKKTKTTDAAGHTEAEVTAATMPFFVKYFEANNAMTAAVKAQDAGAITKAQSMLVRAVNQQERALRSLLGAKTFDLALKNAIKAAKE